MRHLVQFICGTLMIGVVVIGVSGCGSSSESPVASSSGTTSSSPTNSESAETPATTSDTSGDSVAQSDDAADIAGRVTLRGDVPPPRKLSITKDVETCGAVDTITDVEVSDGGVANVVIEVKGVKGNDWSFTDPKGGYVFRQKDCQLRQPDQGFRRRDYGGDELMADEKDEIGVTVPLPPADAKVHTTVCDYCIVGCGYKVYTWPEGNNGGTAAKDNALGVDFPVDEMSGQWIIARTRTVIVSSTVASITWRSLLMRIRPSSIRTGTTPYVVVACQRRSTHRMGPRRIV